MMRTIHLHGHLKKKFGASHRFEVDTAAEGLRALNCAFPGEFIAALKQGAYRIVRGDRNTGMLLDLNLVNEFRLGRADFHIIPVAQGAANGSGKGTAKVILGGALIGGAIFMSGGTLATPLGGILASTGATWGNIAAVGLAVSLSGASTLLAKADTSTPENTKADDHSFMLNGPGAVGKQGSAIPLIYGRCMVTPVPITIDADIEDIGAYQGAVGVLG